MEITGYGLKYYQRSLSGVVGKNSKVYVKVLELGFELKFQLEKIVLTSYVYM